MSNVLLFAGKNSKYKKEGAPKAGFWVGFWHGMTISISFLISLFNENYSIYETNNKGRLYEFGFILATGSLFSIRFNYNL